MSSAALPQDSIVPLKRRNRIIRSCLNCHSAKQKVRVCYTLPAQRSDIFVCSATGTDPASAAFGWGWCDFIPYTSLLCASPPLRPTSVYTRWTTPPGGTSPLVRSVSPRGRMLISCPRDDPNVDENTRLLNRIAELESILRALRGSFSTSI